MWRDARKWLSGLSGLPGLAFWDLDPKRLGEVGSVLWAINSAPLERIQHAAVIGTDNRLHETLSVALHGGAWRYRLLAWLLSARLKKLLMEPEQLYDERVMDFGTCYAGKVADEYRSGVADLGAYRLDREIHPRAHDFVIPSVSQLLLPICRFTAVTT